MNILVCIFKDKPKPMVFIVPDTFDVSCVTELLPKLAAESVTLHEILGDEINVCSGEINIVDLIKEETYPDLKAKRKKT